MDNQINKEVEKTAQLPVARIAEPKGTSQNESYVKLLGKTSLNTCRSHSLGSAALSTSITPFHAQKSSTTTERRCGPGEEENQTK
jgi:hypothetical protein